MSVKFSKDHEWVSVAGDIATIGITNHAQEQLGDVVFVELPAIGKKVSKGGDAAVVESVKAASEVYAPSPARLSPSTRSSKAIPPSSTAAPKAMAGS